MEWFDGRLLKTDKLVPYINHTLDARFNDCFWRPIIRMIDLKSSEVLQDDLNRVVFVIEDRPGKFVWVRTFDLVVHCGMDIAWYPMDTQFCSITFITCE